MESATLDFPTLETPPPVAAKPALPAVAAPAVASVTPSIKETVLAQFKDAEVSILALAEKYRAVAFDVTTTKGMNEAKAARLELREKGRFAVQRAEKSVKADVNDLKRVMSDEVERLVAIVQPVEDAIDAQIKAEEDRKAREKAERERIEAERVAAHQARLDTIGAYLTHCQQPGMTAKRIEDGITKLAAAKFGPDWQEFAVPAADLQCKTLEAMRALHARAVEREAEAIRQQEEAARLEAQRIENERVAAELAEDRRRLAAQQAELDRRAEQETQERRAREAAEADRQRIQAEELAAAKVVTDSTPAAIAPPEPAPAAPVEAVIRNPPFAAPAAVDLLGDAVTPPAEPEDAAQALADCRSALTHALAMLDELIVAYAPKRAAVGLFARVSTLRDLGGLPRATPTTN